MTGLFLAPAALSLLVLGAHFLRGGQLALVAAMLGLLGLLLVRRRWAARTVQAALLLGALEWVRATVVLARERAAAGTPYGRMVAILGAVATLCAVATLAFRSARVRRWFRAEGDGGSPG